MNKPRTIAAAALAFAAATALVATAADLPERIKKAGKLVAATQPLVLFLDDDIAPEPGLVSAHHEAHREHADVIVAGRVLQPWDEGQESSRRDAPFAGPCVEHAGA